MKEPFCRQCVSAVSVLCMIAATISLMFVTSPAVGVTYEQPLMYKDGEQARESFSRSLEIMDLNGDGISDLVVGVPYAKIDGMKDAGSVRIFLSVSGVSLSRVVYINGTHAGDLFGFAVANVGDVNGDGHEDLAVGAPYADPGGAVDAGNVTLFYGWSGFKGKANVTLNSSYADERFGYALSAAGDVDGDGKADMIVGAPLHSTATLVEAGRACVFYGGSPMNSVADINLTGDVAGGHFGWSVSGSSNIDNDASMDMIVGAPDEILAGKALGAVHVYRNIAKTPQTNVIKGAAANDKFGYCVKMVGDINGDTYGDVAIGAPFNDDNGTDAGEVTIFLGGAKFDTRADIVLMGQAPGEWFGFSIASGDIHTDLYNDVIVGAPNSSLNATLAGRAYVFYGGAEPSTQPDTVLVPGPSSSFFGGSLVVGGNLTGSSAPDFAVGDPQYNLPGQPNAGRAYIYAGAVVVIPKNPWIWGYVYSPSKVGLPGFTITLKSTTTSFSKSMTTTANGSYGTGLELTAVPGTYWLNASKAGYVLNTTIITLAMDQVLRQDFVPDTVPIVRGVVRDAPTAAAIRSATVAMYNGTTLVQSAVTPANGTYWMSLPTEFMPAPGKQTNLTMKAWDGTHYTGLVNVSVKRSDTKYVNFSLDRFPVVNGVVQDAVLLSAIRNARIVADQGGIVLGTAVSDLRGNYELVAVNATTPGSLTLNVTAPGYYGDSATIDVTKNGTYTQDFFLWPDTTPPTSTITTVLPTYTNTTVITLAATAYDDNGIREVQLWYRRGGTGNYALYDADQTSPYTYSFNTTTTGNDGRYEFYTRAVDLAGLVEAAPATNDTWTIVDTHRPYLSIAAPTEDQTITTSTVTASWVGSDTGSGILWYRIQLDAGGWINKGTATSHTFTGVMDGNHSINVTASDKAQLLTTKSVNFTVSTPGATSQVDELPTYEAVAEFTITATAVANLAGIKEVQLWYRFNSAGSFVYFGNDTTSPYAFQFDTSMLQGDGIYEFYSIAVDNNGYSESPPAGNDTWTIVDTGAPVVTISAPLDDHYYKTSAVPAAAYTVTEIHSYTVSESGYSTAEGVHTYTVTATDVVGNVGSDSVTYTVDNTAPVVTISAPLDDHYYKTSTVPAAAYTVTEINPYGVVESGYSTAEGAHTYTVTATDGAGNAGTASVTYTIDNTAPVVTITAPLADHYYKTADVPVAAYTVTELNPYTVTESGYSTAEGIHTYEVTAVDEAGNIAVASATYTVDNTPPVVTITAPLADHYYTTSSLPEADYTVNDASPCTFVVSGYSSAEGVHTCTVTPTDAAGNVGETASVAYTVDNTAPVVTISAPLDDHYYKTSTVPAAAYTVTEINPYGVVESGYSTAEGAHTYTVTATDGAGNAGTASVTYTVDNTPPTVTITSPTANQELKESALTVTWTMVDSSSGVALVKVSVDGGAFDSLGVAESYQISNLDDGDHSVTVQVTDNAGNVGEAEVDFTVSTGAGISAIMLGGIALVIIVVIVAAILLMRRRKGPTPEKKEPEK